MCAWVWGLWERGLCLCISVSCNDEAVLYNTINGISSIAAQCQNTNLLVTDGFEATAPFCHSYDLHAAAKAHKT